MLRTVALLGLAAQAHALPASSRTGITLAAESEHTHQATAADTLHVDGRGVFFFDAKPDRLQVNRLANAHEKAVLPVAAGEAIELDSMTKHASHYHNGGYPQPWWRSQGDVPDEQANGIVPTPWGDRDASKPAIEPANSIPTPWGANFEESDAANPLPAPAADAASPSPSPSPSPGHFNNGGYPRPWPTMHRVPPSAPPEVEHKDEQAVHLHSKPSLVTSRQPKKTAGTAGSLPESNAKLAEVEEHYRKVWVRHTRFPWRITPAFTPKPSLD